MSELALFIVGLLITIPVGGVIAALVYAAVLDGRENDRIANQVKHNTTAGE